MEVFFLLYSLGLIFLFYLARPSAPLELPAKKKEITRADLERAWDKGAEAGIGEDGFEVMCKELGLEE